MITYLPIISMICHSLDFLYSCLSLNFSYCMLCSSRLWNVRFVFPFMFKVFSLPNNLVHSHSLAWYSDKLSNINNRIDQSLNWLSYLECNCCYNILDGWSPILIKLQSQNHEPFFFNYLLIHAYGILSKIVRKKKHYNGHWKKWRI